MVRKSRTLSERKVSPPEEAFYRKDEDDGVVVDPSVVMNGDTTTRYKWDDPEEPVVATDEETIKAREEVKLMLSPTKADTERTDDDDDEDGNRHDQLPNVEEAMLWLNKQGGPTRKLNKQKVATALAFFLLFVGSIVFLKNMFTGVLGLFHHDKEYEVLTDRTEQIVQFVLDHRLSNEPSILDAGSPQRRAAQFLADGDLYVTDDLLKKDADYHKLVERYVLVVMWYSMNGDHWTHQLDFLSGKDHCHWHKNFQTNSGKNVIQGVECNSLGRVTKINLEFNNLRGAVPSEIQHLTNMDTFHAQFNEGIHGSFPVGFEGLRQLRSIGLQYCNLGGTIPSWIGSMTQLTALSIGNNKFQGTFPADVGKLHKLKFLAMDNMGLTGNINQPLKHLQMLETLFLDNNALSGQVTELVGVWTNMKELDLSSNMLDGTIPKALLDSSKTPDLQVLDLHKNLFYGTIPNDIYQNSNLQYLALQNNLLDGTITDRIGFLEDLKHLDLSYNQFTGTIPNTVQGMTNLQYLATSGNKFFGQYMMNFGMLTNLRELHMKQNGLTGTIPEMIGQTLTNLRMLDLHDNQIYGTIPESIGKLTNLNNLLLNRNELTGTIPAAAMTEMRELKVVLFDKNNLSGSVQPICDSNRIKPTYFISDCYPGLNGKPEVDCQCCTSCCADTDPTCNNKRWKSDFDPEWEYGFVRPSYKFDLTNLPAIPTDTTDYTEGDVDEDTVEIDAQP